MLSINAHTGCASSMYEKHLQIQIISPPNGIGIYIYTYKYICGSDRVRFHGSNGVLKRPWWWWWAYWRRVLQQPHIAKSKQVKSRPSVVVVSHHHQPSRLVELHQLARTVAYFPQSLDPAFRFPEWYSRCWATFWYEAPCSTVWLLSCVFIVHKAGIYIYF